MTAHANELRWQDDWLVQEWLVSPSTSSVLYAKAPLLFLMSAGLSFWARDLKAWFCSGLVFDLATIFILLFSFSLLTFYLFIIFFLFLFLPCLSDTLFDIQIAFVLRPCAVRATWTGTQLSIHGQGPVAQRRTVERRLAHSLV